MSNTLPIMLFMLLLILISTTFVYQGLQMHQRVLVEEERYHELQVQYFSLSKETRDGAEDNSELAVRLADINNYPSSLMTLKLLGVGNILTGIFALLLGILIAMVQMPVRIASLLSKMDNKNK